MIDAQICGVYSRTMLQESKLVTTTWDVPTSEDMYHAAEQILEVAKASLVLRSYNICYNPEYRDRPFDPRSTKTAARESDGGHTNLMMAIIDRALCYTYGPDMQRTVDGYTYREVMEAIRRHDLPENVTGDTADDGNRDEVAKRNAEQQYQKWFSGLSPSREIDFNHKVCCLLTEMEDKSSPTGRLCYVGDKSAAVISTLCYDQAGIPAFRCPDDSRTTQRDLAEINTCDFSKDGAYYASEMWTIDFLKTRKLNQYDDSGFITALIVMTTLIVNGVWYNWRKQDYR